MIARFGIPGEQHFDWARFTGGTGIENKRAAIRWLTDKVVTWKDQSVWPVPSHGTLSDAAAAKVRWLDGSKVYPPEE